MKPILPHRSWEHKGTDNLRMAFQVAPDGNPVTHMLEEAINNLRGELQTAEMYAGSDNAAKDYWNAQSRRWYQKKEPVSPIPKVPTGRKKNK